MSDYLINPQTGEVVKLTNGQWTPVDKSRVTKNPQTGEIAVLGDDNQWSVAGRMGPVAAPKPPADQALQNQVGYLNQTSPIAPNPILKDVNQSKPGDFIREIPNGLPEQIRGVGQTAANAALLGGGNELAALAKSGSAPVGTPPSQYLQEVLAALDQQQGDFSAMNPALSGAANVTGMIASPANLIGGEYIAAGQSVPMRAGRAMLTGSAVGGTAGGLSTDGGLAERTTGAVAGAGIGSAAGLALQPGMELLGFGAKKGGEAGLALLNTIKNQMEAHANPSSQADKLLARALLDDQMRAASRLTPLPGQGAVNLGGENVSALGRLSTAAPGPARTTAANFFEEQSAGQSDRAADALRGLSEKGYYGTVEELDKSRKLMADPLYKAAYATPAVEVWTPRIADLMKRPSMRGAFAKAQRIAAEEGRDPKELGLDFNEAGDPKFLVGADKNGQIPSAQTMDYVKRGMDDVVEQYRDKTTGKLVLDTEGRAINNTRAELVGILRENPKYAAALDNWGGPSHSLDSVQFGREVFRKSGDPADSIRRFAAMSAEDQNFARIGYMRDAIKEAGNVTDGGSVYNRLYGTPNKRALAEVMFPDKKSFDAFAQQMIAEKKMTATNRMVMGGSPTARIGAEMDAGAQATDALGMVASLKSGNPLRILGSLANQYGKTTKGITPQVADALANRLFTTDPAELQRVLSQAGLQIRPAPRAQLPSGLLRRTPTVPFAGQGAGLLAGQMFSRSQP